MAKEKFRIRRIGLLSLGKMLAIIHAVFGLFVGIVMTLMSLFASMMLANMKIPGYNGGTFSILFGIGAIVGMPIFNAIVGFIVGVIIAFLYNILAKLMGGIEVELE